MKVKCIAVICLIMILINGCAAEVWTGEAVISEGRLCETTTGFQKLCQLTEKNGAYLTFRVENNGGTTVVLFIDEGERLILEPGMSGQVTAKVRDFLIFSREFWVKCCTVRGGDVMDITYRLYQHSMEG